MQIMIRIHFFRSIVNDFDYGQHIGQCVKGAIGIQAHLIQQLFTRWHRVHGHDSTFSHQPWMMLCKGLIVCRLAFAARFLMRLQQTDAKQKLTNESYRQ